MFQSGTIYICKDCMTKSGAKLCAFSVPYYTFGYFVPPLFFFERHDFVPISFLSLRNAFLQFFAYCSYLVRNMI